MGFRLHSTAVHGADPVHWLLVTHGIFGSGANLRTLCKKLVEARPDWGTLLVDLPGHGKSRPSPAPHTVAAAARHLASLVTELGNEGIPVRGLMGHSLGGKVVLLARSELSHLAQTWVLDSSPSVKPDAFERPRQVPRVLAMLESLPPCFDDRDAFIAAVESRGFERTLAAWLAMSLDREAAGVRFGLDVGVMRQLLISYYQTDAWPALESPVGGDVEVVIATRSESLDLVDRDRLESVAAGHEHLRAHRLDSGHWVHIERPEELVELIARRLPIQV